MLQTIINFTSCCRSYGLKVSTSEVIDCIAQINLTDPLDEQTFKTILQANFAKSRREQSRFTYIYNLFFHAIQCEKEIPKPDDILIHNSEKKNTHPSHLPDILSEFMDFLEESQAEGFSTEERQLLEFIQGKPSSFLETIHNLNTKSVKQQKFFKSNMDQLSGKLGIMLLINQMRQKIMHLAGGNFDNSDKKSISIKGEKETKYLISQINGRLDNAYSLLTEEPRENNDSIMEKKARINSLGMLEEKPFSSLTPLEINKVKERMDGLARKLKDQAGRRFAVKNKGRMDIKKTLRHAGKYQGVPVKIIFKNKPLNRANLIVLCDISGSVWSSARFMLAILYSLKECFQNIRSYIFVAEITEITDFLTHDDVNEAIEKMLKEIPINTNAPTDYGATLSTFKKDFSHLINQKSTLIIMGDGRSNYLNPQAHILGELREKCRRIIWLTPEAYNTWNKGDCELSAYRPHCHELRTCMNLDHLTQFIQELVL
ncbi:conserved hypothetical protein [Desulfamplus magnetovallimortis]|uniref:VWA containing CoxE family protein n=1 Tax=Desulfamplus magnetovallimortis TaxID=1246637 RepID=A0A1W1H6I2_9BACT|nr:VWA domain-containing protein [Desulfamplus magnetovallimortis]SLM27978.1 conserved hypothetical protein [Desulfamplus magnetovallimortis]